jgi:hypothetical protein
VLLASVITIAVLVPQSAFARKVKHCGITIKDGGTGTLIQDVTCGYRCTEDPRTRCTFRGDDFHCPVPTSGCTPETIVLGKNSTLDLNGFDLTAAYNRDTVFCGENGGSRCTIKGPGTFYAGKGAAITPNGSNVILSDLTIDRDYEGFTTDGWLRATNVVLQNCSAGMKAMRGVRAKHVSVGSCCGLQSGRNMVLDDVYVADNVGAVGTLRGRDVTVKDGGVRGRDVFLTRALIPSPLDTELSDYPTNVLAERHLVLRDSILGGIEAGAPPELLGSTCMQSRKPNSNESWGVCAND